MKNKLQLILIPYLIKIIMTMVVLTCRIRWHNKEQHQKLIDAQGPYVLCMWHNCCTIAAWFMRNSNITVMVSDSKDGEYVSRLANSFNIHTIRGSASAGTAKAIKSALSILAKKRPIALTPDGSRGPRYKMKSGALWFAASSKSPILPMHIESTRQWVFNSWDKHCFPKPFSTIHVSFGAPIQVERESLENDMETTLNGVEQKMMANVDYVKAQIGSS